jgi:hypothetical protein
MAYSVIEQNLIDKCRMTMFMGFEGISNSDYLQKQVLTDDEIYNNLTLALDDWNLFPPTLTDYTIDQLIGENKSYERFLILGAQIWGLIGLELVEASAHFSVSDDGHSITRDRFGNYAALQNSLFTMYEKQLLTRKMMWSLNNFHIRGQFGALAAVPFFAYKGSRALFGSMYGLRRRGMR